MVELNQPSEATSMSATTRVLRRARRRAGTATALALTVMIAGLVVNGLAPRALGLPVAVAPTLAACAALAFYGARPPQAPASDLGSVRTASLHARSARTVVAPRTAALGLALTVGYAALVVLCGITASADDSGRDRQIAFSSGDLGSTAGPYPGWWYGLPMLVSTLLLAVIAVVVAQRISSTPALPDATDHGADSVWRLLTSRMVLGIALACLALQCGGTSLVAGSAMVRAALPGTAAGWVVLGWGLVIAGLILVGFGVVGLLRQVATALRADGAQPDAAGTTDPVVAAAAP